MNPNLIKPVQLVVTYHESQFPRAEGDLEMARAFAVGACAFHFPEYHFVECYEHFGSNKGHSINVILELPRQPGLVDNVE